MNLEVSRGGRLFLLTLILASLGAVTYFLPPGLGRWQLKIVAELPPTGHPRASTAVALSASGELLASASNDGSVRLWNHQTSQAIAQLQLEPAVHRALFLPRTETLVLGLADGRVALWDSAADAPSYLLPAPGDAAAVIRLAATDDGSWLAAGDRQGGLRLWSVSSFETPIATFHSAAEITALAFAGSGQELAVATSDRHIQRLRIPRLIPIGPPQKMLSEIAAVELAYGPEDQSLWLADAEGPNVWNLLDSTLSQPTPPDSEALVAVQPLADRVVLFDSVGTRFSLLEGDTTWSSQPTSIDASSTAAWSRDGDRLVVGGSDGIVRSWNSARPAEVRLFGAPPLTVTTTDDGRLLASSHGSGILGPGRIELRNTAGRYLAGVDLPAPPPTCLVFVDKESRLEAWHHRSYLGSWRMAPEILQGRESAPEGLASTDFPAAEASCRRSHDRRLYTEVIRSVDGQDLVLQDARSSWLTTLSERYLQVTDVAQRGPVDRLLGRFAWVGLRDDRAIVFAKVRPSWPTGLLLLASVGWIPAWRLGRRLLSKPDSVAAGRERNTSHR